MSKNFLCRHSSRVVALTCAWLVFGHVDIAEAGLPTPSGASFQWGAAITVSAYTGSETLTNFPVLVRLREGSPSGFSYANVVNARASDKNAIDIGFTDSTGTGLPYDIDTWNPNGESLVWVRVPAMTNGTQLVMYWGSSSSGKDLCASNAWSEYVGVWHLGETGDGVITVSDSTTNALSGTTVDSSRAVADGVVGGSRHITDSELYNSNTGITVDLSDSAKRAAVDGLGTNFTASYWLRLPQNPRWSYAITRKTGDSGKSWGVQMAYDGSGMIRLYSAGNSDQQNVKPTLDLLKRRNEWHKFDVSWKDDGTYVIYQDGANKLTGTLYNGTTAYQGDKNLGIGGALVSGGRGVIGEMDEVRLRAFVPSDDWAAAEYATMTNASFLVFSAAEQASSSPNPLASTTVPSEGIGYTNATVEVNVTSIGDGASSATVALLVSTNANYSQPSFQTSYAVQAADSRSFNVTGLPTNTLHHVRLTVANGLSGAEDVLVEKTFTTLAPGAAAGTGFFHEAGFTTLRASATVTSFGIGSQSATVRLEASTTTSFASLASVSVEMPAALDTAIVLEAADLSPDTTYYLRARITNEWGIETFVDLGMHATLDIPAVVTGIGWTFSSDSSAVDFSFGVSALYDGAQGTATLTYAGETVGVLPVTAVGSLAWPSAAAASGTATATVALSLEVGGVAYSDTFSATVAPGSTAVAVGDRTEHMSVATAIRVRPGDVVTLPRLSGTESYALGNNLFATLDGNVLTALRPGILGVHFTGNDGAVQTVAVLVLPDKIAGGDIYIYANDTDKTTFWTVPANWTKVGAETNDSYPKNTNDIAIIALYDRGSLNLDLRDCDVTVGGLYFGSYRDLSVPLQLQCTTQTTVNGVKQVWPHSISFARSDSKPVVLQICPNTAGARYATVKFSSSIAGVEFLSDTLVSGGWDETNTSNCRGVFGFDKPPYCRVDGAVTLVEFTPGLGTTFNMPLRGGGMIWNRTGLLIDYKGGEFGDFTGTLRDSGHGGGASLGSAVSSLHFFNEGGSNVTVQAIGYPATSGDEPTVSGTGVGTVTTGGGTYYSPSYTNKFPSCGMELHGGTYGSRTSQSTAWGIGVAEDKVGERLALGGGMNVLWMDQFNNSQGYPINKLAFNNVTRDGTATLFIREQSRWAAPDTVYTNSMLVLKGMEAHAVGQGAMADCLTSSVHPIVPWIIGQYNSADLRLFAFGTFDAAGRFVQPVITTSDFTEGKNAMAWNKNPKTDLANKTVNSLLYSNGNGPWLLGSGNTLTVTSGAFCFYGNSKLGTEANAGVEDSENGSLILGDASHRAYLWQIAYGGNGNMGNPGYIWTPITAEGGLVKTYTGHLVLGGDQTGIAGDFVVSCGKVTMGTASTPCLLRPKLPVRIYAGATLAFQNALSAKKCVLEFDGAAGWFGKVDVPAGVDATAYRAFWRDYPVTTKWKPLAAGTYTGDPAVAAARGCIYDPDRFSGSGTLTVMLGGHNATIIIVR